MPAWWQWSIRLLLGLSVLCAIAPYVVPYPLAIVFVTLVGVVWNAPGRINAW